jgi:hypothetical protein
VYIDRPHRKKEEEKTDKLHHKNREGENKTVGDRAETDALIHTKTMYMKKKKSLLFMD